MVTKTSKTLAAGKAATTGASVKALMVANPEATKNIKKMLKSPIGKTVLRAIPGVSALSLLGSIAGLMKKDTLPGRLKIIEDRAKERRAGKPMKNRIKKGPDMRARKSAMSDAQKKAGGSTGRDALREAGRGKAGTKRNVVKGGGGIVRDKRGKAVNFGGANKGGKKSREGR